MNVFYLKVQKGLAEYILYLAQKKVIAQFNFLILLKLVIKFGAVAQQDRASAS